MAANRASNFPGSAVSPPAAMRNRTVIRAPSLGRPSVASNLVKLLQYRDLFFTLSIHRIRVRYKQSLLGGAWAIIQPLSFMLTFTIIFSFITKMPSEGAPYAIFAYAALLPWSYFSTSLSNATGGLVSHSNLITKVYFPREILPLTYVAAALFDFLLASVVMVGLMLYYRVPLTINIVYAFPILLLLTLFIIAVSLLFSATQVRFRDVGVAIPLLLQIWMFATPIIYPFSVVPERLRGLYVLNPMVGVIEGFRRVVLHSTTPDWNLLAVSALVTIVLLPVSYIYFKHIEATVADII